MDILDNSYSFCEYLVENVIPVKTQLKFRQIIKDTIISMFTIIIDNIWI